MSGLVDIWTSQLAKLKSKGQAIFSSGSAPPNQEPAHDAEKSAAATSLTGMAQAFKLPAFQCSEASLSMLVDYSSA